MSIWNSFKTAFAMYSRIPVGKADWTEKNMKYSMCFIPLVGMVIGGLLGIWYFVNVKFTFNFMLKGGIAMFLPLFVTGGIHMDGFCDVVDAMSSYRTKEKRLEILKDPHVGAFAIIWTAVYMILASGFLAEINTTWGITLCGAGFVLSRALSCLLAITLKNVNRAGTLYAFTSSQQKGAVSAVLTVYLILGALTVCLVNLPAGVMIICGSVLLTFWFCHMIKRNFGGMTGDMAGYYIQIYEMMIFVLVVISEKIAGIVS